jgi:hypothetical protein
MLGGGLFDGVESTRTRCAAEEGEDQEVRSNRAYIEELRLMDKIKEKMGQISYGLHNTVLYRGSRKKKRKRSKAVQYAIG